MGDIGEEQPEIEIMPMRPVEPERAPAPEPERTPAPEREPERDPART